MFASLCARMLCLVGVYQVIRLGFYKHNYNLFADYSPTDTLGLFFAGLRFDLSSIFLINSLIILLSLIPFGPLKKFKKYFISLYFVVVNGLFICFEILDIEYFQFTGRRLTLSSFKITDDIQTQLLPLLTYYWTFSLAAAASFLLLYRIDKIFPLRMSLTNKTKHVTNSFIVIVLTAIGIRGGLQVKPIIPADAYSYADSRQANLVLNSSFSILKSLNHSNLQEKAFFKDWQTLREQLAKTPPLAKEKAILPPKTNIVLIIMESFSLEYMGWPNNKKGYTPFLDSLAKRGSFFRYNLANGRRSIDALPSILAGIPAWMPSPFIVSPYQHNKLQTLPMILNKEGYKSLFFHGGDNGTMHFDTMASRFGFDRYIGASEYPNKEDHDGQWGIFDEPFLRYSAKTLDQEQEPFFATVFTLTSHHPYRVPDHLKERFPKGSLKIHESVGYADYALSEFFQEASSKDWYENTLFIITADHTSKSDDPEYQNLVGSFRIPLLLYHPQIDLQLNTKLLTQQLDILPTIVDLLGLGGKTQVPQIGQSLLVQANRHVIISEAGHYNLVTPEDVRHYTPEGQFIQREILPWFPPSTRTSIQWAEVLKSKIQYYHNGLLDNRLIW